MNPQRFETLLDIYGAEPRRWPEAERVSAQAFAGTAEGMVALKTAQALDAQLDAWTVGHPSHELRTRVLAQAPQARRRGVSAGRWARIWAPGAGLAAAGLAGVLFGAVLSDGSPDSSVETLLAEAGAYEDAALTEEAAL